MQGLKTLLYLHPKLGGGRKLTRELIECIVKPLHHPTPTLEIKMWKKINAGID